ncbi:MAG: hypothetical protein H8D72_00600, partial [Planctomycetes bacterium]|nr:hypothetical protein [Planctomycetota bacterium]
MPGLRVLVVSPFAAHSGRGNAVTAARVARRLASAGARAEVVHANESFALGQALREAWPDVLVGIHAGHFSRALDVAGVRLGPDGGHFDGQTRHTPAIVLGLGGNELDEDLGVSPGDDERGHVRSASWALFERADAVLVASEYQYELAAERRPGGFFLVPRYPEIGFGPIEGLAEKLAA